MTKCIDVQGSYFDWLKHCLNLFIKTKKKINKNKQAICPLKNPRSEWLIANFDASELLEELGSVRE